MADETPGTETTKPAATLRMDELSDTQFEQSMLTGELPPREAPAKGAQDQAGKDAEAAAAKAAKPPASTDASSKADTESADSGKSKKLPGQKKNAIERAEEIEREAAAGEERLQKALARRRRVNEELADAEREPSPSKRADASREAAAPTDADKRKKYRELPDAPKPPKMDDFKGETALDDYMAAVHAHSADMAEFIAEKLAGEKFEQLFDSRSKADQAAAAQDRQFIEKAERAEVRMQANLKADPEVLDRIPDRWKGLNPSDRRLPDEPMTAAHFVKDQVMFNADNPLLLSDWLCADDYRELTRIARLSPEGIIREIAIKDREFGAGDDTDAGDTAAADEAKPHPRVSKAPAPTKTLPGKKAAAGVDPLKKAMDEGDFDTFNALESERERASARG